MKTRTFLSAALITLTVSGCASTGNENAYNVKKSRLAAAGGKFEYKDNEQADSVAAVNDASGFVSLSAYQPAYGDSLSASSLANRFSAEKSVSFTAENIPLKELMHSVLHGVLGVNYVISSAIPALDDNVSLSLAEGVTQRKAFELLNDLLKQKGVMLTEKDGVIYLYPMSVAGNVTIGVGNLYHQVPQVSGQIVQIVPLRYGNNPIAERTIRDITSIRLDADLTNGTLFIRGMRQDILKALELVHLLDSPKQRGQNVAIYRVTYHPSRTFAEELQKILEAEGFSNISVGATPSSSLVLLPVEHIGAVLIFGSNQDLLDRVKFWAETIDVPSKGPERRYYIYNPRYARAADLGESIAKLIQPGTVAAGNQQRDTQSAMGNGDNNQSKTLSAQNKNLSLTVDERSNSLIFYASGSEYQTILPMVKRLDVLPKQILLEAVIAEVTLSGSFASGVDIALSDGNFSMQTGGDGASIGWAKGLSNTLGGNSINAVLSASDNEVNVLSNPSVVVRDGVSASISVGNDIPVIQSRTSDPLLGDRQTSDITYRKTGIKFSVTPTINAQGLVVMEIDQSISNAGDGSSIDGAQAIFDRSINTEVIAESGQTVMLGGLISERVDNNQSGVPGFSDLPLIGGLFDSRSESKEKTELILLITPRIIDSTEQWTYINEQIRQGFEYLTLEKD